MPLFHTATCGLSVGPGPWAEHRRAALPYRARGCARRHLCAVTGAPACQRFPGRELPSPMLTARQPDELSVSSNSPHSSHSTAPPGRSHCFTFHWVLLLYSALDAYLSSFHLAHGSHAIWQTALLRLFLLNTEGPLEGYAGWQGRTMVTLRPGSRECSGSLWALLTVGESTFISWLWPPFSLLLELCFCALPSSFLEEHHLNPLQVWACRCGQTWQGGSQLWWNAGRTGNTTDRVVSMLRSAL